MPDKKEKKRKKPRIAIVSLTCCEGCMLSIIDKGPKFLELSKHVDIGEFRLIEEMHERGDYDIAFIEGSPVTKGNIKYIKDLRKRSKYVGVLGTCADQGGINEIKNYRGVKKCGEIVYKNPKTIDNEHLEEVRNIIKVDFRIPGCPINGDEFYKIAHHLLAGRMPDIPKRPVCWECQTNGYECLLKDSEDKSRKAQLCFGPITLGGCDAICLRSKQPCFGCRGIHSDSTGIKNFFELAKKITPAKEIMAQAEVFGVRDDLEDALGLNQKVRNHEKKIKK